MGGEHYRQVSYTGELDQSVWDGLLAICARYKDRHPMTVAEDCITIPSERNTIKIKRQATFTVKWQDYRYGDISDPLKDLANELMDYLRKTAPQRTTEDAMDWRQEFIGEFIEDEDFASDRGEFERLAHFLLSLYRVKTKHNAIDYAACSLDDCGYCGNCMY